MSRPSSDAAAAKAAAKPGWANAASGAPPAAPTAAPASTSASGASSAVSGAGSHAAANAAGNGAAHAAATAPAPAVSNKPSATAPVAAPAAPAARKPRGPAWGRYLRARIGSDHLTLELLANRRKPQLLARLTQEYVSAADGTTPSQPTELAEAVGALKPALAALETGVLADGGRSIRGLAVDVVIEDAWMLYDVVRADLRGLSPRAADALIGASLADVAGVAATELVSRWQPQGESPYTLACGLPANAMPVLGEALKDYNVTLGAVEGEFVREYNSHRDALEPKCAVIAVVRKAGTQLGVLVDGVLTSMSFEFGVGLPKELELRGRGLLRVSGVGGDGAVRFYVSSPAGWKAPEPWVSLPAAA